MAAPESIRKLIEHFEQNREALRSGRYNEAQLRQEFLNPFFAALGWDMFNEQQYGEAYKEVIHETSVEVEGAAKAPDYAFRVGELTKFFVEAKKPSINLEHAIHPAYQVKRYVWFAAPPAWFIRNTKIDIGKTVHNVITADPNRDVSSEQQLNYIQIEKVTFSIEMGV